MSNLSPLSSKPARRVWMVRCPKLAAQEDLLIEEGLLFFDAGIRADLSDHLEYDAIYAEVCEANPGEKRTRLDAMARELDLLLNHMQPGDLVLSLLRRSQTLMIGQVMPGCHRGPDGIPARKARWLGRNIAKNVLFPDLIHSLGAYQKVCEMSRNDLPSRIESLLREGRDPGPEGAAELGFDTDEILRILRRQMMARIGSLFAGHRMADLVCALLEAEGYHCRVSPPGPDGGIDILAGEGAFGLSGANIAIQVKSGDIVADEDTLQSLIGAMHMTGCKHAILVSWSGVTRPVQARLRDLWFTCRLWDAGELLDRIARHYDRLPADIRADLPMRMVPVFG